MNYVDTSLVVAYYCPEPVSRTAERLIRSRPQPVISDLTEVEVLSALARKLRTGEIRDADAQRVATQFLTHVEGQLYRHLPIERRHFRMARDWMRRLDTPVRTLDALHLAAAASHGLRLVTTDRLLATSADRLGVEAVLIA